MPFMQPFDPMISSIMKSAKEEDNASRMGQQHFNLQLLAIPLMII